MNCIRLPLEGAPNVRDLGGICTKDNKITKFHTFIRGSRLTDLTSKDNEFLKKYQITDIIDLRGNTKIQNDFVSNDNINQQYFHLHQVPLANVGIEEYVHQNVEKTDFNFGDGYFLLLDNKEKIKQVFKIFVEAEGGVLFHCTAGKDRTGVIAALLLGVCNVDELDIIANYEVTNTYIKKEEFMEKYQENEKKSLPQFMETFISKLKETYGGFEEYLLSCGITKEEIEKLKEKFCEEINL